MFIATCGGAPLDIVREYVASQREKGNKKKDALSRP
jgi:hypothetical protein